MSEHTVEIGGNASGEQASRSYGQRATKVGHACQRATMEDVESILERISVPTGLSS